METLEKNRVFDRAELEGLLNSGKMLFEQAGAISRELGTQVNNAGIYAERVPAEAKSGLVSVIQSTMSSDLFATSEYEEMAVRLMNLIMRIVDNVYTYDSLGGEKIKEISNCMEVMRSVVEDLKSLIVTGILHKDMQEYVQKLSEYQSKWNKSLISLEEKLNMAVTTMKGMQNCSELSKDPVNLSTGNFLYKKTDMEISGKNPLCFSRFYNAMDKRKGVMGRGWRHSFEVSMQIFSESVIIINSDGKEETFKKAGDYLYRSVSTGKINLHRTRRGFRSLNEEGIMLTFDEEGKIIERVSPKEGTVSFLYNLEKQLNRVSINQNIYIDFYYEKEKLVKIQDYAGRKVTFNYEKRKLAQVTDPCGGKIKYIYGENNRIKAIINEEDITTVINEYDENHRVTRQMFPDGGVMLYEYQDGRNQVVYREPNGNQKIYVNDDKMRHIATIQENGMEKYEYNESGQCVAYIDRNGNQTRYEYGSEEKPIKIVNALGEIQTINYNIYGYPTAIIYADGTMESATYDEKGRLLCIEDEIGTKVQITYDKEGRAVNIEMPDGSKEVIKYDVYGNISVIEEADGRKISYLYDELNRIIASVDGNGNRTNYQYDNCNRLIRITNPEGYSRCYVYNSKGDIIKRKNFDGGILEVKYGINGKPQSIINEDGGIINYTYDKMGNIISMTDSEGGSYIYQFNKQNLLEKEHKPDGSERYFYYDRQGNCIKEIDEGGKTVWYEYDALNRLIFTKEENGRQIKRQYDKRGRLFKISDNKGNWEMRSYDSCGRLILVQDNSGEKASYVYNKMGKVIYEKTPENVIIYEYAKGGALISLNINDEVCIRYSYDQAGNVVEACYQDETIFTYHYNAVNKLTAILENNDKKMEFSYDAEGRLIQVINCGRKVKEYQYSKTGKLLYAWEAGYAPVTYSYDMAGRMKSIMRGEEIIQYQRDSMGRITEVLDAMGYKEIYAYDCYGNIKTIIDKEGRETRYSISREGNVSACYYPDGSFIKMEYDELNRLRQIQDLNGAMEFGYERRDKLSCIKGYKGEVTNYLYTEDGKLSKICRPDGEKIEYKYNEAGHLREVLFHNETVCYFYDEKGNLSVKQYPGQVEERFTYDKKRRIESIEIVNREGILEKQRFVYEYEGLRADIWKEIRNRPDLSGWYRYCYDIAGRVTSVCHDEQEIASYCYDLSGNRIYKLENGKETIYNYDKNSRIIQEISDGKTKEFYYDNNGRLLRVEMEGKLQEMYAYNGAGYLSDFSTLSANYKYIYSGMGQILQKEWLSGSKKCVVGYGHDFLRKEQSLYAKYGDKRKESYCYDYEKHTVLAGYSEKGGWFYLTDEAGSPLYVVNREGKILENYSYGLFGEESENQADWQPIGFHGFFREAGKHYLAGRRIYDPVRGRFLSEDIEKGNQYIPSEMNLYVYGKNNPLLYADRTGDTAQWLGDIWDQAKEKAGECWEQTKKEIENQWNELKAGAQKAANVAVTAKDYVVNSITSSLELPKSLRPCQSVECGVSMTLEEINALAGIPQGNQILKNALPEDSYLFQTQQYKDGVAGKTYDKKFLDVLSQRGSELGELFLKELDNGKVTWNKAWEEIKSKKDIGGLLDFWLGNWEGREETDKTIREKIEQTLSEVMDTKVIHTLFEADAQFGSGKSWKEFGVFRYMLDGYDYDEAVALAEANTAQNEKYVVEGMLMPIYDLVETLTSPGEIIDSAEATIKGWWDSHTPLEIASEFLTPKFLFDIQNQMENMVAKEAMNQIDTVFFADDEKAYNEAGKKLGEAVAAAVFEVALSKLNGKLNLAEDALDNVEKINMDISPVDDIAEKGVEIADDVAKKGADTVDDVIKGEIGSLEGGSNTIITPEMEEKILFGQRKNPAKNELIGGHSPDINNSNPNYAVEVLQVNPDGTQKVKFVTQYADGNLSNIKTSTLFPEGWSSDKIINSIKTVGDSSPIGVRTSDGAMLYRDIIDGVQIEVIKIGDTVTSGYPTGGIKTGLLPGFSTLE